MPREASLSAPEIEFIKRGIERLEAIKANRSTRYPRPVWEYVCEVTGRSKKTVQAICAGRYDATAPSSPIGDAPEEPTSKRAWQQGWGKLRPRAGVQVQARGRGEIKPLLSLQLAGGSCHRQQSLCSMSSRASLGAMALRGCLSHCWPLCACWGRVP